MSNFSTLGAVKYHTLCCLDPVRVAASGCRSVREARIYGEGLQFGRTAALSRLLPSIGSRERECFVVLVSGETVLARMLRE